MTSGSHMLRFHAYLEYVEERSVLTMSRNDWVNFGASSGSPVQIDVTHTPMGDVAQSASVIAAFAVELSASAKQIHIYRWDPADTPSPINLDKYSVWEDLSTHKGYDRIVRAASVSDSEELRSYLDENVFLAKEEHGPDHWLSALPGSAITAMNWVADTAS